MTDKHVQIRDELSLSRIIPGLMRLNEWDLSAQGLLEWIETCLEMGLTTFDHADIYGSYTIEEQFGAALALRPELRSEMEIVTKCGIMLLSENRPHTCVHHYNTTYDHIIASAERSLQNFQTDYLDVLLIHRPDPLMNADDVAAALGDLVKSGKVRYPGVSNFTPSQFELLQSRLDMPLVTNQVECSVTHMEPMHDGTFDQLQQKRIAPMVWSPMAGGSIFNPQTDQERRLSETMQAIATAHDARLDQIALAWLLKHPVTMLPVLGTGKLERIRAAVDALEIDLTQQQWFEIWEASAGHEVP
jgi:predicted oxidoreductase